MEKADIEAFKKGNMRYRLLKTVNQYYILDSDTPFFIVYFLPLLIYFVPHRCYPITYEEYQDLADSQEVNAQLRESFKSVGSQSLGIGLIAIMLSRLFDINRYLQFNQNKFSYIFAVVIPILVFILRLWVTNAYKLPKSYSNKGFQKLFIFPCFFKELILYIIFYIMAVVGVIALIYGLFTEQISNYIAYLALFMFSLIWFNMGNLLFLRMSAEYRIKVTSNGKLYYRKNKSA